MSINPYAGYGPAQALKDTGDSLADMMKSLLAVKIENAKLDIEGKKIDLEKTKTEGGLQKELSLAELAGEKERAEIRQKEQELGVKREEVDVKRSTGESEAAYRDRLAGVYERRTAVNEGEQAMKQREEARLNRVDTYGNLVMGSFLPPAIKKVVQFNTPQEEWDRKTTVRDFKTGVEQFFTKNPDIAIGGLVMGLGAKIRQAEQKVKNAKSEDEANAIFANELEPAAYHMEELRRMLGDGPEMSEKDRKLYAELGMKAFSAAPDNYKDEAEAIEKATNTGAALKKAYWGEQFPAPEKRKEKLLTEAGFRKKAPESDPKAIVMGKLNELEGLKDGLEAAGLSFDKIKKNVGKDIAANNVDKAASRLNEAFAAANKAAAGKQGKTAGGFLSSIREKGTELGEVDLGEKVGDFVKRNTPSMQSIRDALKYGGSR